jgi:cephalosporin hydroxylase
MIRHYIIVFDTDVQEMPRSLADDRPWEKGNNPNTSVFEYLKESESRIDALRRKKRTNNSYILNV